ncbi:PucR family transcriptional regulator [Streptomyces poriticola]|uniref:PucR family transcriptional regulator n=1 Tax=Streptomyces poriticola TaxID=3120506 RepID=UPI002FCDF0AE
MLAPVGSLFVEPARQATANARREVGTYTREIPGFGFPDREHTALMLREINEATEAERGRGIDDLMRMMTWFTPQGERGVDAYRQGFVRALRRRIPYTEQVALLTRSLLSGDPFSAELAAAVGMELPDRCAVTVFRLPDRPTVDSFLENEIGRLVKSHRVPVMWGPEDGGESGELIALIPLFPGAAAVEAAPPQISGLPADLAPDHLPDVVRDFARALGRPCAVGTAAASRPELPDALDRARRISRAAPVHRDSARLRPHTLADLFVELSVADVPFVDDWLRTLALRLESGPDLLVTLDAYYRHDMHRGATASALNVHARTLDYRLRRVRELTGIAPGSTRGVRTFSAVVARRVSGAWR